MSGPEHLLAAEDHWVTSLGAFIPSEGRVVMHGKDLHHDLADLSWMELLMFSICGRRLPSRQVELFQGLWKIGGSYPEPRIWNNRVSAIGGCVRTTPGLALGAAIAASDARIFGRGPDLRTFDFLLRARLAKDGGESLSSLIETELRQKRVVSGYGRPLRSEDERIQPMLGLAKRLGFDEGPHVRVAFEVRDILVRRRMGINAAAVGAALCADQGLTRDEYYRTCLLMFSIGLIACEYDAHRHPEGTFMPLRCDRIESRGPAPRSWEEGRDLHGQQKRPPAL